MSIDLNIDPLTPTYNEASFAGMYPDAPELVAGIIPENNIT